MEVSGGGGKLNQHRAGEFYEEDSMRTLDRPSNLFLSGILLVFQNLT